MDESTWVPVSMENIPQKFVKILKNQGNTLSFISPSFNQPFSASDIRKVNLVDHRNGKRVVNLKNDTSNWHFSRKPRFPSWKLKFFRTTLKLKHDIYNQELFGAHSNFTFNHLLKTFITEHDTYGALVAEDLSETFYAASTVCWKRKYKRSSS